MYEEDKNKYDINETLNESIDTENNETILHNPKHLSKVNIEPSL